MTTCHETVTELLAQLVAGDTTSLNLTEACLQGIATHDEAVGAFLHVAGDSAREAAESVDRRRAAGEPLGPLAGLPVAIKDVLVTTDQPTTCGSRMLEGWTPPYDAHVIQRLRQADAVLIGKTNMDRRPRTRRSVRPAPPGNSTVSPAVPAAARQRPSPPALHRWR